MNYNVAIIVFYEHFCSLVNFIKCIFVLSVTSLSNLSSFIPDFFTSNNILPQELILSATLSAGNAPSWQIEHPIISGIYPYWFFLFLFNISITTGFKSNPMRSSIGVIWFLLFLISGYKISQSGFPFLNHYIKVIQYFCYHPPKFFIFVYFINRWFWIQGMRDIYYSPVFLIQGEITTMKDVKTVSISIKQELKGMIQMLNLHCSCLDMHFMLIIRD